MVETGKAGGFGVELIEPRIDAIELDVRLAGEIHKRHLVAHGIGTNALVGGEVAAVAAALIGGGGGMCTAARKPPKPSAALVLEIRRRWRNLDFKNVMPPPGIDH